MELEELKTALNWNGVYHGRDCLVVEFDAKDSRSITGLSQNEDTFFLKFPEFQKIMISFLIREPDGWSQYWVLGDRLHRNHGPAKIYRTDKNAFTRQTWYRNGLMHNDNGPAMIELQDHHSSDTNPVDGTPLPPTHVVDTWRRLVGNWWINGEQPRHTLPTMVECIKGYRCHRFDGNVVTLDNHKSLHGFHTDHLEMSWDHSGPRSESFRINRLELDNYNRDYIDDEFGGHSCDEIHSIDWLVDGTRIETNPDKRKVFHRDMFNMWNIWDGPLFPNEQEAALAHGELHR